MYAEHEAARAKARDALKEAIVAEVVARYEAIGDKGALDVDPVDIGLEIMDWEERHLGELKDEVIGAVIARYPEAVPS